MFIQSCRRCLLLLALLALAACGTPETQETPTPGAPTTAAGAPAPTPSPTAVSATPPVPPTPTALPATPTPADAGQAGSLPAPVYLLANTSGSQQIWRVETDGQALTQITDEPNPVIDFDVSPVDGSLAYVTDNDLILSDGQGRQRSVLIDGPPMPTFSERDPAAASRQNDHLTALSSPRWAPDGTRLAFSLGGVNLIGVEGGPQTALIKDHPRSAEDTRLMIYVPGGWAADGSALQIRSFIAYSESLFTGFVHLDQPNTLIEMQGDQSQPSGTTGLLAWTDDSRFGYVSSGGGAHGGAGLWRINTRAGEATPLLTPTSKLVIENDPYVIDAEHLRVFAGRDQRNNDEIAATTMSDLTINPDGTLTITPLRKDSIRGGRLLWARDGSGAISYKAASAVEPDIMIGEATGRYEPFYGSMIWLPADGGLGIRLPVTGKSPRWGR